MGIVGIILSIISNLPQIISIIKEIVALISGIKNPAMKKQAYANLAVAYQKANDTGDAKDLHALHDTLLAEANDIKPE